MFSINECDDTMSRPAVHHTHYHKHTHPVTIKCARFILSYRFTLFFFISLWLDINLIKLRNRQRISWVSSSVVTVLHFLVNRHWHKNKKPKKKPYPASDHCYYAIYSHVLSISIWISSDMKGLWLTLIEANSSSMKLSQTVAQL